jgi:hypothetical protein
MWRFPSDPHGKGSFMTILDPKTGESVTIDTSSERRRQGVTRVVRHAGSCAVATCCFRKM